MPAKKRRKTAKRGRSKRSGTVSAARLRKALKERDQARKKLRVIGKKLTTIKRDAARKLAKLKKAAAKKASKATTKRRKSTKVKRRGRPKKTTSKRRSRGRPRKEK